MQPRTGRKSRDRSHLSILQELQAFQEAPILVIGGFAFEIYAIMKRFDGGKSKEE